MKSEIFQIHFFRPWCRIKPTLKGINSPTIKPYFAKLPSIPHINCPCNFFQSLYTETTDFEKLSIKAILNKSPISNPPNTRFRIINDSPSTSNPKIERINTPKRLLKYCLSHDIVSEYDNGILVNDIIVDARNILRNNNYKGFSGIRLIAGNTYKFDKNKSSIIFTVSNPFDKTKQLNAEVFLSDKQLKDICNYIFRSFDKFSMHSIAVLGDWKKISDNNIECTVDRPANVIYRFANEQ